MHKGPRKACNARGDQQNTALIDARPKRPITLAITLALMSIVALVAAMAAEAGRIKRTPPDAAEASRIASETVMNDGLLQKGDIVVTDRGYFVFRGVAADGYTFEFAPVPNPATGGKIIR